MSTKSTKSTKSAQTTQPTTKPTMETINELFLQLYTAINNISEISPEDYDNIKQQCNNLVTTAEVAVDEAKLEAHRQAKKAERQAKAAEALKASNAKRQALRDELKQYRNAGATVPSLNSSTEVLTSALAKLKAEGAPKAADAPKAAASDCPYTYRQLQGLLLGAGYQGKRSGKGITKDTLWAAYQQITAAPAPTPAPTPAPAPEVVKVVKAAPAPKAPAKAKGKQAPASVNKIKAANEALKARKAAEAAAADAAADAANDDYEIVEV